MGKSLTLDILTPERTVFSGEVKAVYLWSMSGYIGILPDHAPMITGVPSCALHVIFVDGAEDYIAIGPGFMEVRDNKISLLVKVAEMPEEIDVERAEKALHRAAEKLRLGIAGGIDVKRARLALQKAKVRIYVSQKHVSKHIKNNPTAP